MKKYISFIVVLSALNILLFGCAKTNRVKINQLAASRFTLAEAAENLPEISDLIVVFTPESQENVLTKYPDGNVSVGYTKTSGIASQVLSGSVSEGDSILITEECYTTDSGSVLWTQDGYLPMNIGESYLLFLKAYDEDSAYAGMYFPVDLEYGKYVLQLPAAMSSETSYTIDQLEIGPYGDLDHYIEWFEAVQALYPDIFSFVDSKSNSL